MINRFSFIIPSYQHSAGITDILNTIEKYKFPCIIINDGSSIDHSTTLKEASNSRPWVHLIEHESNQGKGAAVISGLREAHRLGFSHAIQVDSDGQHDLSKIQELIACSLRYPLHVVSGLPNYDSSVPKGRKFGRYITHIWVWIETCSFKIKDSMCGFRIYPLESSLKLLNSCNIGKRMDFDIEVLVRLHWQGVFPKYVPVKVIYPEDGSSHFRMFLDNVLISKMHSLLVLQMPFRILLQAFRGFFSSNKKLTSWYSISEKGSYIGIKTLLWIHSLFGKSILKPILFIISFYYSIFARTAKLAHRQYKNIIFTNGVANNLPYRDFSFHRHIYSFATSILDKIAVWKGEINIEDIEIDGRDQLSKIAKKQEGAIFISAHFGNIEIARALGKGNPYNKRFHAIVYNQNAVKFNKALEEINRDVVLNMISVENFDLSTAVNLKNLVDNGDWIFIMADRSSLSNSGSSLQQVFLGEQIALPQGPFILSYLMECDVYSFLCFKKWDKFYIKLKHLAGAELRSTTARNKWIDLVSKAYLIELGTAIYEAPTQWFNFFKFWKE